MSEKSTLIGPVVILDVMEPDFVWFTHFGPHPIDYFRRQAGYDLEDESRCLLCNQKITWRVIVKDSRGIYACIGRDCARQEFGEAVDARIAVKERHAQDRRERRKLEARKVAKLTAAQAPLRALLESKGAIMRALRHPSSKPFARKLTLADYAQWWLDQGERAKPEQLAAAVKMIEERLNPAPVAPLAGMPA